ncbi:pathogenesis-related protein 1A [Dorcoceras hygrometricum]|uniref:Pathogenesis-related protein 1A n=1 Tax=Dorcoceras hygrometricum TaxID=472368 RepID=A0A2Z7B3M0_9LAMI|nr:pathogenesis-related protein 1A [Dorcoceras hygrometricum]
MLKAKSLGFLIIAAAFIASTAAGVVHSVPKTKLRRRNPIKALPPPKQFVPTFNWEQKEYLDAHNFLRQKVGVPPLQWDATLTASAHAWAEQRRVDCDYRHHSPNGYGENLYWMDYNVYTPAHVVHSWFNEHRYYDAINNVCRCVPERNGCECGHFLNVVWASTKRVGCSGAFYCDGNKGVYAVCQYDPAGLIVGANPFAISGF